MTVELFNNTSPTNYINKAISPIITLNGTLKDSTNVLDPVIVIENINYEYMNGAINYARIIEFGGRYYYVTNIEQVYNRLWEMAMHVDVLMSNREKILMQTAIIARQEQLNMANMYLDDGWFIAEQRTQHQTLKFSVSNPFSHYEYVLVVAGS